MTLDRARDLRANMTSVEWRLWRRLRRRAIDGRRFRRQRPVGPHIVDFICLERGLVIEVDGGQHDDRAMQDAVRTRFLEQEGL